MFSLLGSFKAKGREISYSTIKMSSYHAFDLSHLLNQLNLGRSNVANEDSEIPLRQRMRQDKLMLVALDLYEIEHKFVDTVRANWNKATYRKCEKQYAQTFKAMIWLEEDEQAKFLKKFTRNDIRLTRDPEKKLNIFCLKNDEEMEKIDDAINENLLDQFILKENGCSQPHSIQGQIKGNNKEFIFLEINENDVQYIKIKAKYTIEFQLNRLPFQVQHLGLKYVVEHNLVEHFINNPMLDNPNNSIDPIDPVDPTDSNERCNFDQCVLFSKLNAEQRDAVTNIIAAKNQPVPYILYGPPGTGKTQTLVAAIEAIVRSTSKKILVCANSNAACDEIAGRLVGILTDDELLRFYAKKFDKRKMSSEIEPFSNWVKDEFHHSALSHLLEFRVIICTLCTAACLTRAGIRSRPNHFSYIIIDEAASTHESMAMVAIAGLCTNSHGVGSSVVIAGDPKQLDAVTKSREAAALGYKISLMEYLFERRLYQRDPITGKYNGKFITQLVKNYRSHSAILHMPNKLFYDGTLQSKAKSGVTDWFIGSSFLRSKKFPIIFHEVNGIARSVPGCFSLFNSKEIKVVLDYITELLKQKFNDKSILPSDIGVISPYKLQCKQISRALRRYELGKIAVGTAEVFQGQERPIIIVSTVRSSGFDLGFVSEPRRLNVIITRAKCLLIIVGNRLTLSQDTNWKKLIEYCIENCSLIGWR